MKLYIEKIIVPYIQRKKTELKLPSSQQTLCIIGDFLAQCITGVTKLLDHHAISIVYVPVNCTGELQPLDLSVNKLVKNSIMQRFQEWHTEQIVQQKEDGSSIKSMADFPMQLMKLLGAKWIMEA